MTTSLQRKCSQCGALNDAASTICTQCYSDLSDAELITSDSVPPGTLIAETPEATLEAGTTLGGRYEIKKVIGQGGMGVVYKAYDQNLRMEVALKTLPPLLAKNDEARESLLNEARKSIHLRHDNIVAVYNAELREGIAFITMEHVAGSNLKELLQKALRETRKPLPYDQVRTLLRQVCEGLRYAHGRQHPLIHKDLKPANIILSNEGVVKIADFGLAQVVTSTLSKIAEHSIEGSPAYMAPEQHLGRELTPASDIYSLGVTAYQLLSGDTPFPDGDIREQAVYTAPPPLNGLPEHAWTALARALEKRPDSRYDDALAFWQDFAGQDLSGKAVRRPSQELRQHKQKGSNRRVTLMMLALFAMACGIVVVYNPLEYVVNSPHSASEAPQTREAARLLLDQGKARLEEGSLFTPPGEAAVDAFNGVLALEPGNEEALVGLQQTAAGHVEAAMAAHLPGSPKLVRAAIKQAAAIHPERTFAGHLLACRYLERGWSLDEGVDPGGRFLKFDKGFVLDTDTGLHWAPADNGEGLDWTEAKRFCGRVSNGGWRDWRLPNLTELRSLYQPHTGYTPQCWSREQVHLTDQIRLSCGYLWSSETRGEQAAFFRMDLGFNEYVKQAQVANMRALAVRGERSR